jgi:hypothetical protein
MKKCFFCTIVLFLLFFSGYLEAQVKVWQPYIQFFTDGGVPCIYNPAEAYFIVPTAEGAQGGNRYADGHNFFQYHFNLVQFQNIQNMHPLYLRCYLWGEFVVEVSSTPITDVTSGQVVAQYAPGPPWTTPLEDGSNAQWVNIPLDQYYALGQTDIYLSFFDGKSEDGWGPSVTTVGLWYYDTKNSGTTIDAALTNDGVFNINNDISAWPAKTQWVSMQNGATGITSIGNTTGLSASVGIGFDNDNIYFGANVTESNVANSDSVIFYFANYDLTDSLNNWGHTAFVGDSAVTGYRMQNEPDYRFVVTNINGIPTLSESKLVDSLLSSNSNVTVTKNSKGYVVQVQIARTDLKVAGKVNVGFAANPNTFYPVAFKVVDGVSGGALITGGADVDNNPTSWGLKANADTNLVAFVPGGGDQNYLVADSSSGANSQQRWANGNSSFGYRFNLASLKSKDPTTSTFYFNVHIGGEWKITVAKESNAQQYPLGSWGTLPVHNDSNMAWHSYSLKPYIDSAWSNVVFFFHDGLPSDGYPGSVVSHDNGLPGVKITSNGLIVYTAFDTVYPGTASETPYLVTNPAGYTGSGVNPGNRNRWADGTNVIAYVFNKNDLLAADGDVNNIVLLVNVQNEYVIWVNNVLDTNASSQNLKMLYQYSPNRNITSRFEYPALTLPINLSYYFNAGWDTVYVLFRDGRPQDGWGPLVNWMTINTAKSTSVKRVNNTIPNKFALGQNYPNPFNPSTIISYDIPTEGKVVLQIYNMLGQEVRTLFDDVQASGSYQVTWNGENNFGRKLASGIYLYRMLYNQQQIVKKMMLLK